MNQENCCEDKQEHSHCCFCNSLCNVCSQACGSCARKLTFETLPLYSPTRYSYEGDPSTMDPQIDFIIKNTHGIIEKVNLLTLSPPTIIHVIQDNKETLIFADDFKNYTLS